MRIRFSPQRSDTALSYEVDDTMIVATLDGQAEALDFSGDEDGVWAPDEETGMIDDLGLVIAAWRKGGEVHVTLRSHHGPHADESERFPEPVEVTEPAMFSFPKPDWESGEKQETSDAEG